MTRLYYLILSILLKYGQIRILYNGHKEGMMAYFNNDNKTEIYTNNPFNNVLITDYMFNPGKQEFNEEYTPDLENRINNSIKSSVIEQNDDNEDIAEIFKGDANNLELEQNSRQFFTNPITTIPNKQDSFLEFCYGTLPSEKPLIIY